MTSQSSVQIDLQPEPTAWIASLIRFANPPDWMIRELDRCRFGFGKTGRVKGYPPAPRSIEIIGLARNRKIVYGAQSVAGKIFQKKDLGLTLHPRLPANGRASSLWKSKLEVTWVDIQPSPSTALKGRLSGTKSLPGH